MRRQMQNGTAEDEILRRERGQRIDHFPCLAVHEQDWQSYLVDPYSASYNMS